MFSAILDPHFLASEDYTFKFAGQLGQIIKFHRRITKHYCDMAATGSDLGAAYNGWSLTETNTPFNINNNDNNNINAATSSSSSSSTNAATVLPSLAEPIEAVGQAIDTIVTSTALLTHHLTTTTTEPLADYEKLSNTIERILKTRHGLHVDYETCVDALISKKAQLVKWEAAEAEACRLAAVLNAEGVSGPAGSNRMDLSAGKRGVAPLGVADGELDVQQSSNINGIVFLGFLSFKFLFTFFLALFRIPCTFCKFYYLIPLQ